MTKLNCEYVREAYPDALNGNLDAATAEAVRAHISSCEECRADAALLDALHAHAPAMPAGLHERVLHGLAQPRTRRRFSRADTAMVATLAAALIGGSVILQTQRTQTGRPDAVVQTTSSLGAGFVGVEDAMLSGDASLDDLSVEQLEKLLGEMES